VGNKIWLIGIVVALCFSCNQPLESKQEIAQYLGDPGNGTVVKKTSGRFELTLSWLPAEIQALSELRGIENKTVAAFDSLQNSYNDALAFKFTLKPQAHEKGQPDLLKGTTGDYSNYKEIFEQLNFNLSQYISLTWNNHVLSPTLTRMENTYGLTPHRTFILVFAAPNAATTWTGEADLVFTDEFFGTGINHFIMDLDKCQLPQLNIDKILHTI